MLWLVFLILCLPTLAWSQTTNSRTQAGDGTPISDTTSGRLDVTVQNPVTVSGTVTVTDGAGALNVIVDSLPTVTVTDGAGALNVIVDSGSITANAGTNLNTSALFLDATYTGRMPAGASPTDNESNTNTALSRIGVFNYVFDGAAWDRWTGAVSQSGTWNITNISGTVSLPTGAATSANQDGIIRDGTGDTTQANVSSGRLQVDGSGVTQPVSGTVTVTDGAGALNIICDSGCGGAASFEDNDAFVADTTAVNILGALYDTTPPAITDGNAGAVRMNSSRALLVDGSAVTQPVSGTVTVTDGAGALNVICDSGCGGAATFTDNSAFTFSTTAINNMGAVVDDTGTNTVTENSAGAPRMNTNRILYSMPTNSTGTALYATPAALADDTANPTTGGVAVYVMCFDGTTWDRCRGTTIDSDDNTIASAQSSSLVIDLVYNFDGTNWKRLLSAANALNSTGAGLNTAQIIGQFDDASPTAITENQFGNLRMSANRNLFGTIRDAAGNERGVNVNASFALLTVQTGELPAGTQNIGDVDIASLPNEGTQTAANSISVTIASDIATGATGRPTDAAQGLVVRQPAACTSFIAISQTADTQLVTGVSGQRIYICSILLVANAAETISLISGTGSVCATSATAIYGSTTESSGMAIAANGGIAMASSNPFIRTSVDTDNLCLMQVGSSRITGGISYVVAAND